MHSAQLPLEALADEFGAAAGRIERELRLKDEARAARFEARLAAVELAAFKAEEDRQRKFEVRMAELRDGKDGEPGRDGKDADVSDLVEKVQEAVDLSAVHLGQLNRELTEKVNQKLAEVKDGKDGEPGRDGKDADIQSLKDDLHLFKSNTTEQMNTTIYSALNKVNERLAEVKDGNDGESGKDGKDADIEPLKHQVADFFDKMREDVSTDIEAYKDSVEAEVLQRLAEIQNGKDGEEGPPGKDGKDGQDGKMPIAREWTNRVHYAGDVVRHNGATYQALTDTGREPPHGDWGELASRGTDGRGFVLRGTYDASAEYRQHDVVMINRNSFAARYDNPGECPGDGWTLFAASGQRGKEGPPGSPGAKGADGRIISITKWEADPDEMVLRIVDSTENTFSVDLQPIAERILEAAR